MFREKGGRHFRVTRNGTATLNAEIKDCDREEEAMTWTWVATLASKVASMVVYK